MVCEILFYWPNSGPYLGTLEIQQMTAGKAISLFGGLYLAIPSDKNKTETKHWTKSRTRIKNMCARFYIIII